VDNVDKTVHNLVFAYDRVWIKLWMKKNMSDIDLICHLLANSDEFAVSPVLIRMAHLPAMTTRSNAPLLLRIRAYSPA
jgi:hypothetical protein